MKELKKHIHIGYALAFGLVLIAGLRGLPENSQPVFGNVVAIALIILGVCLAINYNIINQHLSHEDKRDDLTTKQT